MSQIFKRYCLNFLNNIVFSPETTGDSQTSACRALFSNNFLLSGSVGFEYLKWSDKVLLGQFLLKYCNDMLRVYFFSFQTAGCDCFQDDSSILFLRTMQTFMFTFSSIEDREGLVTFLTFFLVDTFLPVCYSKLSCLLM